MVAARYAVKSLCVNGRPTFDDVRLGTVCRAKWTAVGSRPRETGFRVVALFLFCVLLAALTLAFKFAPQDSTGTRPILSGYSLVLLLFVVYALLSGGLVIVNNYQAYSAPGFSGQSVLTKAFFIALLALASFLYGYWIMNSEKRRQRAASRVRASVPFVTHRSATGTAWVLVALGLAMKIWLIASAGGLASSTIRLSAGVRQSQGLAAFSAADIGLRGLSSLADAGATWLVVTALVGGRKLLVPGAALAAVMTATYITGGKRLLLVVPCLAVIWAVHLTKRRLTVRAAPIFVLVAIALGMASLLARIILPAGLAGTDVRLDQVNYAQGSILRFYFNSAELSSMQIVGVIEREPEAVSSRLGGTTGAFMATNVEPFAYAVPRAVWPGKPAHFYDIGYSVASLLTNVPISDVQTGYISTIVGVGYLFGGYPGLLIWLAAFGAVVSKLDRRLSRSRWTVLQICTFAVALNLVFQGFRQGTAGWTFINGIMTQSGFLLALLILAVMARPGSRTGRPMADPQFAGKPRSSSRRR